MGAHNDLNRLNFGAYVEGSGGIMWIFGGAVPTDGMSGFATGCILQRPEGIDENDLLYVNVGTPTNCQFESQPVTVA